MNSERFNQAVRYACEVHADQARKGSDTPYVAHLFAVCALVLEHGADEDQAIAALLHDAAEDQGGRERLEDIRERFGERVARIVRECSDTLEPEKPPWRQRKQAFIDEIPAKSPSAQLVILADKLHNARTIAVDYRVHGEDLWRIFKAGDAESVIWYYRSVCQAVSKHLGQVPLAVELERVIDQIEELAAAR